jgi:hypothetical protein
MAVRYPKDMHIPPEDWRAIQNEMADKPGDWRVFEAHPDTGVYSLMSPIDGDPDRWLGYKIQLDVEPLFDLNQADFNDSQDRRFPDEVLVARVPDHLLYSNEAGNIGQAIAEDDWKHVKKILNDSDFRSFRSFRGNL